MSVRLDLGPNEIVALATDSLGNTNEARITVTRVEVPAEAPTMEVVSGNGQTGQIGSILSEPIVVQMFLRERDGKREVFPGRWSRST